MARQKRQFDPEEAARRIIAPTGGESGAEENREHEESARERPGDRLIQRSFYLYESQAMELKIRAAQNRTDMSSMLREALEAYLK